MGLDKIGQLIDLQENSWTRYANCRGADSEIFFPERGESVKPAKAICSVCVVQLRCLKDAMDRKERFGIWGGLSERERRRVRSQRRKYLAALGVQDLDEEDEDDGEEEFFTEETSET